MSVKDANMKETKITLYEYFRSLSKYSDVITKDYLRKFDKDNSFLLDASELNQILQDLTGQKLTNSQKNYLSRFVF
jgi:hypothetical protein